MKKNILWILLLLLLLAVGWILFYQQTQPEAEPLPEDAIAFSGEFSSDGVGPAENYPPTPQADDLVMTRNNVDSSDHLFVPASLYTSFIDQKDLSEGTVLYFNGWVQRLEGAAGNHYYKVVDIDELKKVEKLGGFMLPYTWKINERTQESINEQIDRWNYCEMDSDCEAFYGECPFGCHLTVNKQFVAPAQQLINQRREAEEKKGNPQCVYGCVALAGVQCREQKCVSRGYLPPSASRPESVDTEDLERFRKSPEDTRETLQERRDVVDAWLNGESHDPDCQLSADGRYVICT